MTLPLPPAGSTFLFRTAASPPGQIDEAPWRPAQAALPQRQTTAAALALATAALLSACAGPQPEARLPPAASASTPAGAPARITATPAPAPSSRPARPGSAGLAVATATANDASARDSAPATPSLRADESAPATESTRCSADPRAELLQRLNALRAGGLRCGGTPMPPALPLAWHPALARAALDHAQDMVRQNYFAHRDRLGRNVDGRVSAAGYDWGFVAENIAAGQSDLATTLRQWQDSPGHCRNLMATDAQDVGLACVRTADERMPTRWVLVLAARPR